MSYFHVASKKFCCCLPVRIGVFVLSLLSAIVSGIMAFALWYVVARTAKYGTVDSAMAWNATNWNSTQYSDWQDNLNTVALDKSQYYLFIVVGIITTLYALFSVFGFIGSVIRSRALVAFYSTALWISLIVNIATGAYVSYANIKRRKDLSHQCAADTASDNDIENSITKAACSAATKVGVAVGIVIVVVQLLIQLYACIIVKRYVEQLSEEQAYSSHMGGNRVAKGSAGAGSYYPHMPLNQQQHHELMPAPGSGYAYAGNQHSFGSKV